MGVRQVEAEESSDEEMGSDDEDVGGVELEVHGKTKGQKPYWGSTRYRGLLGFLPVGTEEEVSVAGRETVRAVEVVVVERPVWDVGLPPRFWDGKK